MSTRTQGFIDKISDAEKVDSVKWMFSAPLQNLADSVVDSKIKTNAEWQAKAGIPARIVRRSVGKCCDWCQALVGTYTYPDDVPDDVYRRHDNCNCLVEYFPGDGKKQNVHTKAWEQETAEDLEARKNFAGVEMGPKDIAEITSALDATDAATPQEVPKELLDFEKKARSLKKERAMILDTNGDVYAIKQGTARAVAVPDVPEAGYILSHNHTAPVTFSVADVKGFEKGGYKQIRAVTSEKTYILEAINPKMLPGEERDFTGAMSDYWAELDAESEKRRKQIREMAEQIEDRAERIKYVDRGYLAILNWRNNSESKWLYNNAKRYGYRYFEILI